MKKINILFGLACLFALTSCDSPVKEEKVDVVEQEENDGYSLVGVTDIYFESIPIKLMVTKENYQELNVPEYVIGYETFNSPKINAYGYYIMPLSCEDDAFSYKNYIGSHTTKVEEKMKGNIVNRKKASDLQIHLAFDGVKNNDLVQLYPVYANVEKNELICREGNFINFHFDEREQSMSSFKSYEDKYVDPNTKENVVIRSDVKIKMDFNVIKSYTTTISLKEYSSSDALLKATTYSKEDLLAMLEDKNAYDLEYKTEDETKYVLVEQILDDGTSYKQIINDFNMSDQDKQKDIKIYIDNGNHPSGGKISLSLEFSKE